MTAGATVSDKRSQAGARQKRRLNQAIRDVSPAASDQVAFVCECGTSRCFSIVWLPAAEFDSRRADATWALCTRGHRAVAIEEAA